MAESMGDGGGEDISSESFRAKMPGAGGMAVLVKARRSRELARSSSGVPLPLLEVEGGSASSVLRG